MVSILEKATGCVTKLFLFSTRSSLTGWGSIAGLGKRHRLTKQEGELFTNRTWKFGGDMSRDTGGPYPMGGGGNIASLKTILWAGRHYWRSGEYDGGDTSTAWYYGRGKRFTPLFSGANGDLCTWTPRTTKMEALSVDSTYSRTLHPGEGQQRWKGRETSGSTRKKVDDLFICAFSQEVSPSDI